MNKPNYFYPNVVNNHNIATRPKLYFRDIHESRSSSIYATHSPPQSYFYPTPPIYQHQRPPQSDSGLCDGLNNCHLADSWVNYMNQHVNLPITQITNQIPILNSYMPAAALKMQSYRPYHPDYATYHKNYLESIYEHQKSLDTSKSMMQTHPQQQLLRDGLSRRVELNYEASTNDHQRVNKSENSETIYDNNSSSLRRPSKDINELSDDELSAMNKKSIKFQDRNKKLDFKTNFRDINRKINGCFYDSESDLSSKMRIEGAYASGVAPPPKKKWIKNYMTAFAGILWE